MPRTLEKTRKQIAKKKKGNLGALHEGSRDSRRLRKALVRDERLEKIAAGRRRQEQPMLDRAAFFQQRLLDKENRVLEASEIGEAVKEFVNQHSAELTALKQARRPGRAATVREDLLRMKVTALEKEYQKGFLIPDLTSKDNVFLLSQWEGSWSHLTTLSWVRITDAGVVRPGTFPPNKD